MSYGPDSPCGPAAPATWTFRAFQNADAPAAARLVTDSVRGHWTSLPEQFRESADPLRRRLVELEGKEVKEVIATWLGADALAWARAGGFTHAGTGGMVPNLPMLRVNARLGYRVGRMWVTWEQPLSG
ncbi:hypothetical protein [Deinococcus aerophilus]|uniref:hypothetical protein n=1 Tax=Deinococcus aerophilus TaxID=522488 RepID=UPI001664E674|nr:hypothetical protein [Deinococcus aerophilus]